MIARILWLHMIAHQDCLHIQRGYDTKFCTRLPPSSLEWHDITEIFCYKQVIFVSQHLFCFFIGNKEGALAMQTKKEWEHNGDLDKEGKVKLRPSASSSPHLGNSCQKSTHKIYITCVYILLYTTIWVPPGCRGCPAICVPKSGTGNKGG